MELSACVCDRIFDCFCATIGPGLILPAFDTRSVTKKTNSTLPDISLRPYCFREDVCRENPCIPRVGMKLSAFSAARAFICLSKASVRQHGLPQFPYGKLLFASLCLKFPQLALQAQFPSSALINCWAVRPDTPPCRNSNWSARRSSSSSASVMPWRSASASTIS